MKYFLVAISFLLTFSLKGQFVWQQGGVVTKPVSSFTPDTIAVMFSNTGSPPTNWNVVSSTSTVSDLVYKTTGTNSGASVALSSYSGTLLNSAGGYCSSPTYLDNALYLRCCNGANNRTITFSSVPSGTYRVEFMASRDGTGTSTHTITIGGNTSAGFNAIDNCGSFASLSSIAGGGTITVTIGATGTNYASTCLLIRTAP